MLATITLSSLFLGGAFGAAIERNSNLFEKRAQCSGTLQLAQNADNQVGGPDRSGTLWIDANMMETHINLKLAQGSINQDSWLQNSQFNNVNEGLPPSNDDKLWVALAYLKIGDYIGAGGGPGNQGDYYSHAEWITGTDTAQYWTSNCGGGLQWQTSNGYKNTITNALWLLANAEAYHRGAGQGYLDNANKVWSWLSSSGLQLSNGLWADGKQPSDCSITTQTWTYNQGVIASGLGSLYSITGDASLKNAAERTLDATISLMTQNNILKESCDDPNNFTCNQDQRSFKGLFMKHLQYYLDRVPSSAGKYQGFINAQASGVIHYGTGGSGAITPVWYTPNGVSADSVSDGSGENVYVAAAKYGPCPLQ